MKDTVRVVNPAVASERRQSESESSVAVSKKMPALRHGSLSSQMSHSIPNSSVLIKVDFLFCCWSANIRCVTVKWSDIRNVGLKNGGNG